MTTGSRAGGASFRLVRAKEISTPACPACKEASAAPRLLGLLALLLLAVLLEGTHEGRLVLGRLEPASK